MIKYFNEEEQLQYDSIPTDIIGARGKDSLLPNPTSLKESKMEVYNYFKDRKFILETLSDREKEYFCLYYGLTDGKIKTTREVAVQVNISTARVGQIIAKSIRKLRHPARWRVYTILTDEEVKFDESDKDKFKDWEYLSKLKSDKLDEIEKKRFDGLTEEEKTADKFLRAFMTMDIKEFMQKTGAIRIDDTLERLSKILESGTNLIYIRDVLELPAQKLKEEGLEDLIKYIKAYGLHFEEEATYREDFNKMCYESMKKVGLHKINAINPIKYSRNILNDKIEDLDLSVRSYRCLKRANINTVGDIVVLTEDKLYQVENLGGKSAEEVISKIQSLGLNICPKEIDSHTWIKMMESKFNFIEDETKKEKHIDVLDINVKDLGFSVRTYNCLVRGGKWTVRDIVMTSYEKLLKIRNLGKGSYEEIANKLKEFDLPICPADSFSPEEWIEEVENILKERDMAELRQKRGQGKQETQIPQQPTETKDTLAHKRLDINDIPEEYRRAYTIGAGEIAKKEMKEEGLIARISRSAPIKKVSDTKPIKYTQKQVDEVSDEEVLKIIAEDVSVIDMLETSFIVKYKDQLIKAILSNTNVDVEQRFKILNFVNEAKIEEITK